MPVVAPFRGVRYNRNKVGSLNRIVTQPYDKITSEMRDRYYAASEHNFVRLILNRDPNPYESARALCDRWLKEDVLRKDQLPAIYPYRQVFAYNGRRRTRRALICLCRLEPLDGGRILPHERTLSKPKEDRLNLMRATGKQFEQVFMLYSDEQNTISDTLAPIWKWTPELTATDEFGVVHSLWSITEETTIRAIQRAMRPKVFVIADGHHRYETALAYRDEMCRKKGKTTGREAFNYRLVACVNIDDSALIILPTHRLIRGLTDLVLNDLLSRAQSFFDITARVPESQISSWLSRPSRHRGRSVHSFILCAGEGKSYSLVLRDDSVIQGLFPPERSPEYRDLDVAILHTVVIQHLLGIKPENIEDHVSYERDWRAAWETVQRGDAQLALLVHPTRPEQVSKIAANRERMPQKSTDFYPKLISGLVFFDMDENEVISE